MLNSGKADTLSQRKVHIRPDKRLRSETLMPMRPPVFGESWKEAYLSGKDLEGVGREQNN